MKKEKQILVKQAPYSLYELYDKYAGMLLGYICQTVADDKLAEQHLISIYNVVPKHIDSIYTSGENSWCQLQRIAKKYLASYYDGLKKRTNIEDADCDKYNDRNRYLNLMTREQKEIFCNIYYNNKTTAQLSNELQIPKDSIRKTLKDAFAIIKKGA